MLKKMNPPEECFGSVTAWKRNGTLFVQKYKSVAVFGLVFGALLYSMMMSQQLTNTFDGLWNQNNHAAGVMELTSGRWLLLFLDKALMGLHADPLATVAALCLLVVGFLLVLDLFEVENPSWGCLCMALFLSSTAVSNTLSYRYTSLGYGLACLFAVLGVYLAIRIRHEVAAMAASGVFLGLSMSCYQAYCAVFGMVAVFYLLFQCSRTGEDSGRGDNLLRTVIRLGGAVLVGAAVYVIPLWVLLKVFGTSLSAYNGIGDTSLGGMITGLPGNILKTYQYFAAYFTLDGLKINRLQPFGALYALLALLGVLIGVIAWRLWKGRKQRIAIFLLAAAAIPVAGNAYMLIAGDKLELQMTAGLAMLMPLTAILAASCFREKRLVRTVCAVFCVALLYGNSMQVWYDQEAMYEGRNASQTIATQVIADLQREDLLSADYEYFFVGVPAQNPLFSVSEVYHSANAYAQVGRFWVSGNCCQMSYRGLIEKYMGLRLKFSQLLYEDIAEKIDVSQLPEFPNDGYITLLEEGIVVIKISEYQDYTGYSKYELAK